MTTQLLNYRISGSGSPVVFLHGFMEEMRMWEQLTAQLPHTCISIDLHGHGASFFDASLTPSISKMAAQVAEVLSKESIANALVVGHSLGGYVGLELMKQLPQLEHLVLFHSHPWDDPVERKLDRNRVIELVQTKADLFIKEAIPNLFAHPNNQQKAIAEYSAIAQKMSGNQIAWAAAAMRDRSNNEFICAQEPQRFTVIQGKMDKLIPAEPLKKWCYMSGVNYVEIPDVGHMSHVEDPNRVFELLKIILEQ